MTATRTEDRLVAALQGRADQVRPEDLAPFVAPEPGRSRRAGASTRWPLPRSPPSSWPRSP